jgi:hypothetical protein
MRHHGNLHEDREASKTAKQNYGKFLRDLRSFAIFVTIPVNVRRPSTSYQTNS